MQRNLAFLMVLVLGAACWGCDKPAPAAPAAPEAPSAPEQVADRDEVEEPSSAAAPESSAGTAGGVSDATLAQLAKLAEADNASDLVERVDLPSRDKSGTPIVTFEQLASYRYPRFLDEDEEPPTEEDIPDAIKALDGQTIVVSGYMMPTKVRNGRVEKFMLVPNTLACCFGKPLELNEWVNVDMGERAADSVIDIRVAVQGKLTVGENKIDGWVMDLYRMDGESVRIQEGF